MQKNARRWPAICFYFPFIGVFTKVALKLASVRFKKYGVMLKRRVGGR